MGNEAGSPLMRFVVNRKARTTMADDDRRDRPNVNITSHNQTGGITAHTVNVGRPQRAIDDDCRNNLLNGIPGDRPVAIRALLGDTEAITFAEQIRALLIANGYRMKDNATGISQCVFVPTPHGTIVTTHDDHTDVVVGANG